MTNMLIPSKIQIDILLILWHIILSLQMNLLQLTIIIAIEYSKKLFFVFLIKIIKVNYL